jgi:hypothetical protein
MGTGGAFPGCKARPGRNADHSPPSSAEVVNDFLSPQAPSWRVVGQLYFYFTLLRHLPGGSEENHGTTKTLNQDRRSPCRDLDTGPPEYEVGVLTTLPRRSIIAAQMTTNLLFENETYYNATANIYIFILYR